MLRIADPHLGPVDDVVVLVFLRPRLKRKRVASGLRLREAEAAHLLSERKKWRIMYASKSQELVLQQLIDISTEWNFYI